jgi:hypothetical protein
MAWFKQKSGFEKAFDSIGNSFNKGMQHVGTFFERHPKLVILAGGLAILGFVAHKERHKVEEREQNYYGNAIQQVNAQQYAAAAAMQAAGPGSQINCSGASLEGLLAEQQQRAMG